MNVEQWKTEITRRAAQWADEQDAAEEAHKQRVKAEQRRRAAEWPIERIRALMAGGA